MIFLNIQGYIVQIVSNEDIILNRIKMDFEYFLTKKSPNIRLSIDSQFVNKIPSDIVPKNLKPLFQRHNSITYEKMGIRYNDYYGKVVSVFNSKTEEMAVTGTDLEKLYEVIYLLILSRSGKYMDLAGLHKIHAFSVVLDGKGLVCMQPMRGGKSTLFTQMMLEFNVEVGSDDTPLIGQKGTLLPFPLRVSLDAIPEGLDVHDGQYYLMKREFYKSKYSVSLKSFNKKISEACSDFIFVEAHRSTFDAPQIIRMSRLRLFKRLFHHMVIGFGLPIIFEYFWESGPKDFMKKTMIFLKRFTLAARMALTKPGYDFYLTKDTQLNAREMLDLIKKGPK
ncbi:MAG: hypothetical protein ACXVCE_07000 [Bacteriovorax sp.]